MHTVIRPLETHVAASLRAADPYYRPLTKVAVTPPAVDQAHPLDPAKTLRDLGRTEP